MQQFLEEWTSKDPRFYNYGAPLSVGVIRREPTAEELEQMPQEQRAAYLKSTSMLSAGPGTTPKVEHAKEIINDDYYGRNKPPVNDDVADDDTSVSSDNSYIEKYYANSMKSMAKAVVATHEAEKKRHDRLDLDDDDRDEADWTEHMKRLDDMQQKFQRRGDQEAGEKDEEKRFRKAQSKLTQQKQNEGVGSPRSRAPTSPRSAAQAAQTSSELAAVPATSPQKSSKSKKKAGRQSIMGFGEDENKEETYDPEDSAQINTRYDAKFNIIRDKINAAQPEARKMQLTREAEIEEINLRNQKKNAVFGDDDYLKPKKPPKKHIKEVTEKISEYQDVMEEKIQDWQLPTEEKKQKKTGNPVEGVMSAVRRYYKACESIGVHFNEKREQENNNPAQRQSLAWNVKALSGHSDFVVPKTDQA